VIVTKLLGVAAAGAILLTSHAATASASPAQHGDDGHQHARGIAKVRAATTKYHSLARAQHDGYALLTDVNGISCIADGDMGAMGYHYVKGDLVGDPAIVPTTPEALVYAPDRRGRLHLAAVEYVVVKAAWDATHSAPPALFGQTFNFTDAPNRYGLPPFYSLHVWLFKHNPAGLFAMFNPNVVCPA
jgi:hypothetical protein